MGVNCFQNCTRLEINQIEQETKSKQNPLNFQECFHDCSANLIIIELQHQTGPSSDHLMSFILHTQWHTLYMVIKAF